MRYHLLLKVLLIALSVFLLGTTACGRKQDPRDLEIAHLRNIEDAYINTLNVQVQNLTTENAAIRQQQQPANSDYVVHLTDENNELREAMLKLATNPPELQVAGILVDQNQKLQDSLVQLISDREKQQGQLQGQLLDNWVSGPAIQFGGGCKGDCGFGNDCQFFSPFGMDAGRSENNLPWRWVDGELQIGDF